MGTSTTKRPRKYLRPQFLEHVDRLARTQGHMLPLATLDLVVTHPVIEVIRQ